ncbi:hypothetical protein CRG98_033850 [Punica granatum]|uniref:Transposase MuDR plant domain-containing protein n=1 Tax=Punica granatum TaxID=22663 RepID=A0A2I0IP11_PUNGR|nr:hypothetical protein CRG98_033850 [Punica granatum]
MCWYVGPHLPRFSLPAHSRFCLSFFCLSLSPFLQSFTPNLPFCFFSIENWRELLQLGCGCIDRFRIVFTWCGVEDEFGSHFEVRVFRFKYNLLSWRSTGSSWLSTEEADWVLLICSNTELVVPMGIQLKCRGCGWWCGYRWWCGWGGGIAVDNEDDDDTEYCPPEEGESDAYSSADDEYNSDNDNEESDEQAASNDNEVTPASYEGSKEFIRALKNYTIYHGFSLRYLRSGEKKVEVICKGTCYRTRAHARELIRESIDEQYHLQPVYADELNRAYKNNTFDLALERWAADQLVRFKRMYVCFDSLKMGFLEGCRPVIGVDGCFLKSKMGGGSF